ncbi:MAG TPA: hypothetical protein EYP10_12055, partial [Armatimonadetes bacterium]|nr:hypothetical protein [Armatimonadota bacterium]
MRRVSPVRALDVHKANILLLSRGILILLCVLVIILECNALSLDGRRTRAIAIKKWTVMVYQCGD